MDYFHLQLEDERVNQVSTLGLAHIGDGVYELMVRSWLVVHGKLTNKGLHRATIHYVSAQAQAQRVERIRGPEAGQDRFFRLCAQYVSQNIFTAIRAEQMAKELGYTRAYLCTRFKQEAGVSLTRYVQQEKVAEAKRLLGEIAALLGFSSQSHFQTVFKQITGETPMAYRRNNQV